jgi:glycosyltransferase involved in cell wall biosynthesis
MTGDNMNVLIIAQYFYPDVGGASTRAYNSALALKMQGCDVTVITAFPHYPHGKVPSNYKRSLIIEEDISGLKVIRTWIPSIPHSSVRNRIRLHLSFIFSSLFGMRHVKKFDIIIAMNPNLFSFYSAIIYGVIFRRKLIRNVDDLWPEIFYDLGIVKTGLAKKLLNRLAKISYQHSSHLIPVSHGYIRTLVDKYKIPREKITVIEQGVDVTRFRKKTNPPLESKAKKIILYSGALNEGYDFKAVIETAKILQSEPVHFIIRGSGVMYISILNMIEENNLTNIEVSNTLLPIDDLVSLMSKADIFLLPMNSPSVFDQGLPTKILEYQALAKPIVCISEGEARRYILQTECGMVAKPGNTSELAMIITKLIRDDSLCKKLGDNGYKNVIDNLTLEKIGIRLLEVIKKTQS